jgi:hypothetical protein
VRWHLFRLYDASVPFVWNSYAALFISQEAARNSRAPSKSFSFGAVMEDHSQRDNGNPYSPLMCILLLLVVGIVVKIGAATQLCHLAQSSCQLALN